MSAKHWHALSIQEVLAYWKTNSLTGLSDAEAQDRLERIGPNELSRRQGPSPLAILVEQFHDFMVIVLIGATAISFWLGEIVDAIAIMAIVLLNAFLGFFQEYRAERSLEALRKLTAPRALIVREGRELELPSNLVVPGDIVVLSAGDRVPADTRLVDAASLECNEAALTGESQSVQKDAGAVLEAATTLADRCNVVLAGTLVTRGRGRGIVVATGMQTEMGSIAELIQEAGTGPTPLQQRLDQLGRYLVFACLLVSALVTVSGILRGEPLFQMFLTGVSLAVAAIPEGLPAVVTIALAMGVERMIRKNVVVRRLHAVETLGCAQVICSDKTGTLTHNMMSVRHVAVAGRMFVRRGNAGFSHDGEEVLVSQDADLERALVIAALCNNENPAESESIGRMGDPTEQALVTAAVTAGLDIHGLRQRYARQWEIPFDSDRRRMSVAVTLPAQSRALSMFPSSRRTRTAVASEVLLVKGAPDTIMELSTRVVSGGRVRQLSSSDHAEIMAVNEALAEQAERVLALAYRLSPPGDGAERDLVFAGLAGMIDPPRPEVRGALDRCREAGMSVAMITGDQPKTAAAIAGELGMIGREGEVMTGPQVDRMSDHELARRVEGTCVFARVSPEHKLRLVRALRSLGRVVAMTGDGVNDAPAVKEADIGIAMGQMGTDVTREASDMVLTDDNFASIVGAVEEGRAIYGNIRKFIRYLLACNTGEVLVMFLASVASLPVPLLPIHILFVNLVTDGLPAIALGVDPNLDDVMSRPPRSPGESIFARGLARRIVTRGVLIGFSSLLVFAGTLHFGCTLAEARTMAMTTLVLSQLFHVFDCRSERKSIFELGFLTNVPLVLAVASSVAALLAALHVPLLQVTFRTTVLTFNQWLITIAVSALGGIMVAARRIYATRFSRRTIVVRSGRHRR